MRLEERAKETKTQYLNCDFTKHAFELCVQATVFVKARLRVLNLAP